MKWEYKRITSSIRGFDDIANDLGEAGWELVGIALVLERGQGHMVSVFKRPIKEQ